MLAGLIDMSGFPDRNNGMSERGANLVLSIERITLSDQGQDSWTFAEKGQSQE